MGGVKGGNSIKYTPTLLFVDVIIHKGSSVKRLLRAFALAGLGDDEAIRLGLLYYAHPG